jgi:hypothetical protein
MDNYIDQCAAALFDIQAHEVPMIWRRSMTDFGRGFTND